MNQPESLESQIARRGYVYNSMNFSAEAVALLGGVEAVNASLRAGEWQDGDGTILTPGEEGSFDAFIRVRKG